MKNTNHESRITNYDVIVIGAGHAGIEAAAAAARIFACLPAGAEQRRVAMFTKSPDDLGALSCNPSVGGPGKSQIIAEIDALGGIMPRAADAAGIHFRMLNMNHGPATRALRAQLCRDKYREAVKELLVETGNAKCETRNNTDLASRVSRLEIIYEPVTDLDIENKTVNKKYSANAIVITTGTFLNGLVYRGDEKIESGRLADDNTYQENCPNLSKILKKAGFSLIRLKTGTPARLYADGIDFNICEAQPSDENHEWFSGISDLSEQKNKSEINCYITRTTEETHNIIRQNIHSAPMYNGEITGTGPRYCPSIEDKIMRFPEHKSHQVFLEPETTCGTIIYPNGISTSLSAAVQDEFIKSIPALENARIERYGYAIEYDAIDARALKSTLESKDWPGIFFAGQINGTSGYEEAAGQGIVAGANAAAHALRAPKCEMRNARCETRNNDTHLASRISHLVLDRTNSFIGVMIDDITTVGLDEPYRMFTSRAEHRLSLRADNAIFRLGQMAVDLGLLSSADYEKARNAKCETRNANDDFYAGYIARAAREMEKYKRDAELKIPIDFDYKSVGGLTNELVEKLSRTRPETVAAMNRLPGMTPAGIVAIMRKLKRN